MTGFKNADTLGATKTLRQHMDHRSIDIVDALTKIVQFCLRAVIVRHVAPSCSPLIDAAFGGS
jgi:hypothetical protein